MTLSFVVIGAGGLGREVRDWLLDWIDDDAKAGGRHAFLGFLDDGEPDTERLSRLDAEHLGGVDWLADHEGVRYYIAVGVPEVRARIAAKCDAMGATPGPALVHPSAVIGSDSHLRDGSIVCPQSVITTNVQVGRHVQLNLTTTVGHDTTLGDFVTVNPGATLSGNVVLEDRVLIGTGAAVNQGLTVGAGSTIGAGAAVVKNIDGGVTAVGVPAKPLR